MTRWRLLVLAWCLALCTPTVAFADDVADEADLEFNLGAAAYQKGDFQSALEHFLASNRLVSNRNVMFNVARTYERMNRYPDAYRWYVRALDGESDPATRARIEQALHDMAPNVAVLRVETDPPGAKIYLDRKDLGERGNSPQRFGLAPGRYTVIAELTGYEDARGEPVTVSTGQEAHVSLKLVRILGTVHVATDAPGARVHVDSEDAPVACETPCDVQVPPGRHTLFVTRPGAQTATALVDVAPRATVTVRPQIVPLTGTLVVDADERDAIIEVDGKPQGFSPAVLTVPVGPHRVRVSLKGFRTVERPVDITSNETSRLNVELVGVAQVEAASRSTEAIEDAPGSVSIIPYQELRAMRYPTVAEALRGTRGVYVSDDRGYVSLGFRGFGRPGDYGNRTLVLLNGQPMNDDWLSSSYVGYDFRTDLDDVERIEVVRGPGSVLYGTGAFSGVVNVVTRGTDEPPGGEVGVSAVGDGVARARARAQTRFGDHGGAWTSVSVGHSSGRDFYFPEYAADGPPAVAGNARGVDGFDVATWGGQASWDWLKLQWSLNSHRKTLPTGEFQTLLGDADTRQTDTRGMAELRAEPKIAPWLEWLTRVYANYYGYRGHFAHAPENGGLEYDTFDGQWVGLEQRFVYKPIERVRVTVGGEVQGHFDVHQFTTTDVGGVQVDDTRNFSLFAGYAVADVLPTDWLKLEGGARVDDYSTFGSAISPRAAVIARVTRDDNVKVLAGKAFRAPSDYELYYVAPGGQLSNPNLSPESAYSAEVEYSHRFSTTWTGLVSVYQNLITDLIALRNVGAPLADGTQNYEYQNTDAPVATHGLETELRREWKEGWMVAASYSYQHSAYVASTGLGDVLEQNPKPGLRQVPNAPEHLGSIKAAVPILQRALELATRVTVEGPRWDRNDQDGNPTQGRTEPMVLWDIVLSGSEPRWRLSYAFGVYNALDWRWSVPVSVEFRQTTMLQDGRTFLATGALAF